MADKEKMFQVKIITPDRIFYTGEVEMIEFMTSSGQIGVYKNHIPLTTVLAPGAVMLHEADGEKVAAVHSGFAEILTEEVTLLAEVAEWPEEIDESRAEAAKQRAEERLQAKAANIDLVRAEYSLRRALTRINVKEMK